MKLMQSEGSYLALLQMAVNYFMLCSGCSKW